MKRKKVSSKNQQYFSEQPSSDTWKQSLVDQMISGRGIPADTERTDIGTRMTMPCGMHPVHPALDPFSIRHLLSLAHTGVHGGLSNRLVLDDRSGGGADPGFVAGSESNRDAGTILTDHLATLGHQATVGVSALPFTPRQRLDILNGTYAQQLQRNYDERLQRSILHSLLLKNQLQNQSFHTQR
jgi:hypothetical protein